MVRSVLVALAVCIGELVPKFDLIMGLIGGTLTGPLIFILPPLFYSKIIRMEQKHDRDVRQQRSRRILMEYSMNDDDDDDDSSSCSDGDVTEETLIAQYGTFQDRPSERASKTSSDYEMLYRWANAIRIKCSEYFLLFFVILFGLTATFAATYFSVKHVKDLQEFWSPCLHNISYSFIGL